MDIRKNLRKKISEKHKRSAESKSISSDKLCPKDIIEEMLLRSCGVGPLWHLSPLLNKRYLATAAFGGKAILRDFNTKEIIVKEFKPVSTRMAMNEGIDRDECFELDNGRLLYSEIIDNEICSARFFDSNTLEPLFSISAPFIMRPVRLNKNWIMGINKSENIWEIDRMHPCLYNIRSGAMLVLKNISLGEKVNFVPVGEHAFVCHDNFDKLISVKWDCIEDIGSKTPKIQEKSLERPPLVFSFLCALDMEQFIMSQRDSSTSFHLEIRKMDDFSVIKKIPIQTKSNSIKRIVLLEDKETVLMVDQDQVYLINLQTTSVNKWKIASNHNHIIFSSGDLVALTDEGISEFMSPLAYLKTQECSLLQKTIPTLYPDVANIVVDYVGSGLSLFEKKPSHSRVIVQAENAERIVKKPKIQSSCH